MKSTGKQAARVSSITAGGSCHCEVTTSVTRDIEDQNNNSSVHQLVPQVATNVTGDIEAQNNNVSGQQGQNEDVPINIGSTVAEAAEGLTGEPRRVLKALWTVVICTLICVISTALYKPARGVVYRSHKIAYYLTLAAIFVSAVAEAFVAFWMSRYPNTDRRRVSCGGWVLCASIGPFVAILAIGGFTFLKG